LSRHFLDRGRQFTDGPWDILADAGRIIRGDRTQASLFGVADRVIVVLRTDAGAVIHVKSWTESLPSDLRRRVDLVTVGRRGYPKHEIETFTSQSVIGHLPDDREVARAVSGEPAAHRRFRRSPLTIAAVMLAARLSSEANCEGGELRSSTDDDVPSTSDVEMPSLADGDSRLRFRFGSRLERPKILDRVLSRNHAIDWSERTFPITESAKSDGQRIDPDPTSRTDGVLRMLP
jgi:hypothetical protein